MLIKNFLLSLARIHYNTFTYTHTHTHDDDDDDDDK